MRAVGRGDVNLDVLLGSVFGILLGLVEPFARLRGLRTPRREELPTHDTRLERPLLAINRRRPRVLRIWCMPPRTVSPDDRELLELKSRGLRVADVRLAVPVHENPAAGSDALGPGKIEHPADHVE